MFSKRCKAKIFFILFEEALKQRFDYKIKQKLIEWKSTFERFILHT